jgi:hypothetical protein
MDMTGIIRISNLCLISYYKDCKRYLDEGYDSADDITNMTAKRKVEK